jgi:CheY-like chemotaxis protein
MRTILIAHRDRAVRDRFAAALSDAHHSFVPAGDATEAGVAMADTGRPMSLLLVDLGLAEDGVALIKRFRLTAGRSVPVVVFSGSISSASQVAALAAMGISGFVNEHAATAQVLPALAPHLFPDNFNRRASPRVILGVPVSYRAGPTLAGAVTLDVGKSGLASRTMDPLPRGAAIQLRFRLPGRGSDIDATGRVSWSDRKVGMGVRFEHLAGPDQSAIDTFVDEHYG